MAKIIVREKAYGSILISLKDLIGRLDVSSISFWSFREITLQGCLPFSLSVSEFERLTRNLDFGLFVSNSDFAKILEAPNFQMIDGSIYGYSATDLNSPKLKIECLDSTLWEVNAIDVA
jgi:hypothetical protein